MGFVLFIFLCNPPVSFNILLSLAELNPLNAVRNIRLLVAAITGKFHIRVANPASAAFSCAFLKSSSQSYYLIM